MAIKNLVGEKFGKLTVLEYYGKNEKGYHLWKCKCDCGNYAIVNNKSIKNGHTKSCGCIHRAKDLTGKKFGNLTVVKKVERKNRSNQWLCKCDCGKEVVCYQYNLERGTSTSCGCLLRKKNTLLSRRINRQIIQKMEFHKNQVLQQEHTLL